MERIAKQPFKKGRQTCIFCGGVPISKEHFWSEWMHPHLRQYATTTSRASRFELKGKTRTLVSEPRVRNRQGSLLTRQVRVVCQKCNSGWMNAIERAARPHLTQMMAGKPVTLTAGEQQIVARWIALKVMVAEHTNAGDDITPQADRTAFMERGEIPPYYRVYVGEHLSRRWSLQFLRHCIHLRRSPKAKPADAARRNVELVVFGAGSLLVAVIASTEIDPDKLLVIGTIGLVRLFPAVGGELGWMSGGPISEPEVYHLADHLNRVLRLPNVRDRTDEPPEQI